MGAQLDWDRYLNDDPDNDRPEVMLGGILLAMITLAAFGLGVPVRPLDLGRAVTRYRITLTPTDDTGPDTINQDRLLHEVRMHGDPRCSDSPIARVIARVLGIEFPS